MWELSLQCAGFSLVSLQGLACSAPSGILILNQGLNPCPLASEGWSLNHKIIREIPWLGLLIDSLSSISFWEWWSLSRALDHYPGSLCTQGGICHIPDHQEVHPEVPSAGDTDAGWQQTLQPQLFCQPGRAQEVKLKASLCRALCHPHPCLHLECCSGSQKAWL